MWLQRNQPVAPYVLIRHPRPTTKIPEIIMRKAHTLSLCLIAIVVTFGACVVYAQPASQPAVNLIRNGAFTDLDANSLPKGWGTAGHQGMQQSIALEDGPEGKKALKLTCTKFVAGFPDSHAMALLMGSVELKKGQFYKLSWYAKGGILPGETVPSMAATVDIVNSSSWKRQFGKSFRLLASWRHYEENFQAPNDLPAANSRVAFFMTDVGILSIADVSLTPTLAPEVVETRTQWLPQLATKDVTNLLPNSSFECGMCGWGGFAPDLQGSGGCRTNLPVVPGEIDNATAFDGKSCLKIHFDKDKPITLVTVGSSQIFNEQVRQVGVANIGWIPLAGGEQYVLACYLKADQAATPARLLICQAGQEFPRVLASVSVNAGADWQRFSLPVRPTEATSVWVAVALDMKNSQRSNATVYIDAIQFEKGGMPSDYKPRSPVESFIASTVPGNVFTDPALGMNLSIFAANASDAAVTVKGKLSITDFADAQVACQDVELALAAKSRTEIPLKSILKGRRGFFCVAWTCPEYPDGLARCLRCAIIDPYASSDSAFGMNTAYPWPLLNQLARKGGLTWMREWTPSWDFIEPRQGQFDFSIPDGRINAICAESLNALPLLPYPSAQWSSTADLKQIDAEVARSGHPWSRGRLIAACAPRDMADFRNYVSKTVEHYQKTCRYYEIFNEPLYTEYSLPARFGYKMGDYLDLLKVAHDAAKAVDKDVRIIAGIACGPSDQRASQFISEGGLQFCDAMNLHLYPDVAAGAEACDKSLAALETLMRSKDMARPIWVTEFGGYANDDPPFTPGYLIGDETMQRCRFSSEREASAGMVKYCAELFGHGVTKVFFHSGASGTINGSVTRGGGPDGSGIFFAYGGAPRKMYPAFGALANLLGHDFKAVGSAKHGRAYAFWFHTAKGYVAIVWKNDFAPAAQEGKPVTLPLPGAVGALDFMGNELYAPSIELTDVPVYLRCDSEEVLAALLEK